MSRPKGLRVCCPKKPDWGLGHVLADDGGAKVTVFRGNHSARFVRRDGVRLLAELYRHFNPMPYALGQAMEPELARQLREQGYGVWQN